MNPTTLSGKHASKSRMPLSAMFASQLAAIFRTSCKWVSPAEDGIGWVDTGGPVRDVVSVGRTPQAVASAAFSLYQDENSRSRQSARNSSRFLVVLGAVFGVVLVVLSKADLAFGSFASNTWALFGLSVAAGLSERLVPDLLERSAKGATGQAEEG